MAGGDELNSHSSFPHVRLNEHILSSMSRKFVVAHPWPDMEIGTACKYGFNVCGVLWSSKPEHVIKQPTIERSIKIPDQLVLTGNTTCKANCTAVQV